MQASRVVRGVSRAEGPWGYSCGCNACTCEVYGGRWEWRNVPIGVKGLFALDKEVVELGEG